MGNFQVHTAVAAGLEAYLTGIIGAMLKISDSYSKAFKKHIEATAPYVPLWKPPAAILVLVLAGPCHMPIANDRSTHSAKAPSPNLQGFIASFK